MKKVLIIGMYNQLGGIESFIMNFYRQLYKDFEFGFVCMYDNIAYEDEIKKLGGKIHKICNVKKNPFKCQKQLIELIQKENYEVVHINMLSAANIVPLKAAKKSGAKTIIAHSHNNGMPNAILKKILHSLNKKKIKKYANVLLACSQEAGKWMFTDEKFTVINNSIDVDKFKYDKEKAVELKKQYNLEGKTVYGHVGRFAYQKNHSYLIDVFNNILKVDNNSTLLLIGNGELKKDIKKKVKELEIEDNVIFIDETKDVNKYYWIMDYFILPSHFEGLGIVAIEAQASGLQCFTSLNVPRDIDINNSVIFEDINKSPEEFAKTILDKKKKFDRNILFDNTHDSKYNIKCEANKIKNIYNIGD